MDVVKLTKEEMDFINQDFWVTHTPPNGPKQPYHLVAKLAQGRNELKDNACTVWYSQPALHVPRTEDFGGPNGDMNGNPNSKKLATWGSGVALTTWIEFTLRPRDLFDSTPLYVP